MPNEVANLIQKEVAARAKWEKAHLSDPTDPTGLQHFFCCNITIPQVGTFMGAIEPNWTYPQNGRIIIPLNETAANFADFPNSPRVTKTLSSNLEKSQDLADFAKRIDPESSASLTGDYLGIKIKAEITNSSRTAYPDDSIGSYADVAREIAVSFEEAHFGCKVKPINSSRLK